MKKILAIILTLSLAVCALALPALAEDAGTVVDQTTSATQNNQTGHGGRNQMPGRNGQTPQMPGQNGQNGQMPQMPGQSDQNGQMPQLPDQNDQNGQNDQNSQAPRMPGRNDRSGKTGRDGRTGKAAKQGMFDQMLADGVITQEIYDAIAVWMQEKAPEAQQDGTAPVEGSEPPALPEGEAPAEGSEPPAPPEGAPDNTAVLQLLKDLLDNGTITQEQYDLLAGGIQVPPAAVPET